MNYAEFILFEIMTDTHTGLCESSQTGLGLPSHVSATLADTPGFIEPSFKLLITLFHRPKQTGAKVHTGGNTDAVQHFTANALCSF